MTFIYVHRKPFYAGNEPLCSGGCVIPSPVSVPCLLPGKRPVVAECRGLSGFVGLLQRAALLVVLFKRSFMLGRRSVWSLEAYMRLQE